MPSYAVRIALDSETWGLAISSAAASSSAELGRTHVFGDLRFFVGMRAERGGGKVPTVPVDCRSSGK